MVPAILVQVTGFKTRTGNLRVQAYGPDPAYFLKKGKWITRVDLPVTRAGRMDVCLRMPKPGRYAVAVRHDVDGNKKSGWNDGGGFSRNPKISLLRLRPAHRKVVFEVGARPVATTVVLNYRQGLSIGPI